MGEAKGNTEYVPTYTPSTKPSTGAQLYAYIKRFVKKKSGKKYDYLVIEEYKEGKKRIVLQISIPELYRILVTGESETTGGTCGWCGGWGLNPRRPTPTGLKPADKLKNMDSATSGVEENILKNGFFNYCTSRASKQTCEAYIRRLLEIRDGRSWEETRWTRTAYKLYLRYLCEELDDEQACQKYKHIKLVPSKPDTYVPSDQEIVEALNSELGYFYYLLIQSGLRVNEVVKIINKIDELKIVELDGYIRISLDWWRGQKKAFWGYFLEKPKPISVLNIYKRRERLGLLPLKYPRKWVSTQLLRLNCDPMVVDFITGHTERKVLARNYANLLVLGDDCYAKYARWLKNWLAENEVNISLAAL